MSLDEGALSSRLLEHAQVGIALSGGGSILACNPHFAASLGYASSADIVGKPSSLMFPSAASYARFGERVAPALAAGNTVELEWPMRRADGGEAWMRIGAKPLPDGGAGYQTVWMLVDIQARKRTEAELQAAAEEQRSARDRLKALFDSSPVGVVIRRPGTNVVEYANAAVLRMLGYSFEAFTALDPVASYVDPAARARIIEDVQRTGQAHGREVAYRRSDGGIFWALVSFEMTEWEGAPAMVSWLADITARREAEAAVRAAGEQQHAILEAATSGMALITNRVLVKCNHRLEEIFGAAPGALDGKSSRVLFRSDAEYAKDAPEVYGELSQGKTHRREQVMQRADGTTFWARFTGRAIDASDLARGTVWSIEDVTDERAAGDALKQALGQLEAIFEFATSGMALISNRVLVKCNRRLEEIFGVAPGSFDGKSTRVWFMSEEEYEDGAAEAYAEVAQGKTHRRERLLHRADGTAFWARFTGRAIDASDLSRGTVWSIEDVTEERAAAEALQLAKETAEAATAAKSTFLATMSHEIRTPMNGVLGMLELLQRTALDSRQRELAEVIRESASSLLKVIDDVLDFSKIESGRLEIECVPMAPLPLVEGVAEVLAIDARKKRLRLVAFVDGSVPPMVGGDPVRLRQILFNLIGNAIKFTERGEVVVRVSVDSSTPEGMKLRAQVSDTGIGLSPAEQERLFQPFVQADGSTTRRFGGTGLGLSICRGLVERMGGEIGVTSVPGRGATFWFTMRVSPSEAPASAEPDLSGLRIRVLEEHPVVRDLLVTYLSAAGAQVDLASGGEVDALVAGNPAQVDARAGPPCILIAPFEEDGPREQAIKSRFASYFVSPVRKAVLLRAVAAACGRDRPMAESTGAAAGAQLSEAPDRESALAAGRLILVAEDNVTNQAVVMRQLAQLGYAADLAQNGGQALDRFRTAGYALVLTDIHMPIMDGLQLTGAIRELERLEGRPRVPVVAFTADVLTNETGRYLAAGVDDSIRKPFSLAQLDEILARWLPGSASRLGVPAPDSAGTVTAGSPVLSLEAMRRSLGRIDATAITLLNRYVESTAPLLADMVHAIAERSAARARSAAHSAVGASRAAGAEEFAGLCAELEQAALGEAWERAAAVGTRLEPAFAKVREAVKRLAKAP